VVSCAPTDQAAAPSGSSPGSSQTGSSATESAATCTKAALQTRTPGKLTVGTDKPAYAPWFVDDEPSNGKGFESAVAYAVAEQLGYEQADVTWSVVSINQVSITEARKKTLDFSTGYYDVAQAVVSTTKSKAAKATTLAELKTLKLGAQVGTTSYTAAKTTIAPTQKVAVYNSNDDAKAALANGQIDAIVVDLPTGLFLSAVGAKDGGIDDGKLVGQLPTSGTPEQFGMVLDKGSALTSCVSGAVDALRADGTLTRLEQQWLTDKAGAPSLQ